MDLTGSLLDAGNSLFDTAYDSLEEGTGSAFLDTVLTSPVYLYNSLLLLIGGLGGDLGSTGVLPGPA